MFTNIKIKRKSTFEDPSPISRSSDSKEHGDKPEKSNNPLYKGNLLLPRALNENQITESKHETNLPFVETKLNKEEAKSIDDKTHLQPSKKEEVNSNKRRNVEHKPEDNFLQLFDAHQSFHDTFNMNNLKKLNSREQINVIYNYAVSLEPKVDNFNEEINSTVYLVLDVQLMQLLEKLDKIKCRNDEEVIKKDETVSYVNRLQKNLNLRCEEKIKFQQTSNIDNETNQNVVEQERKKSEAPLETLNVHQYFQDSFDAKQLSKLNYEEQIETIHQCATKLENKINNFNEDKSSMEYFVLIEKLDQLIDHLSKIHCRKDRIVLRRKLEVNKYINNLRQRLENKDQEFENTFNQAKNSGKPMHEEVSSQVQKNTAMDTEINRTEVKNSSEVQCEESCSQDRKRTSDFQDNLNFEQSKDLKEYSVLVDKLEEFIDHLSTIKHRFKEESSVKTNIRPIGDHSINTKIGEQESFFNKVNVLEMSTSDTLKGHTKLGIESTATNRYVNLKEKKRSSVDQIIEEIDDVTLRWLGLSIFNNASNQNQNSSTATYETETTDPFVSKPCQQQKQTIFSGVKIKPSSSPRDPFTSIQKSSQQQEKKMFGAKIKPSYSSRDSSPSKSSQIQTVPKDQACDLDDKAIPKPKQIMTMSKVETELGTENLGNIAESLEVVVGNIKDEGFTGQNSLLKKQISYVIDALTQINCEHDDNALITQKKKDIGFVRELLRVLETYEKDEDDT